MAVTIRIQTQGGDNSRKAVQAVRDALKEMDEVTVEVSESTRKATQALQESEQTRERSLAGSASAVAKFVATHWALDRAMKAATAEGRSLSGGLATLRRSVFGMTLATTAASSALERMRTTYAGLERVAGRVTGPMGAFLGQLRRLQRLLLVTAGAAGLALLTRRLIALGEAGAQIQPVERAFNRLAESAGVAGDALQRDLRSAVAGTVSDVQLMRTAVLAMNSGAVQSREDLTELAASARVLSRTVGVDATTGLENMVRAIGTMNPVLLKNLGILVNVSDANREYAAELGVAVSQLDENQRKEAFRLAVLERVREGVQRVSSEEQLHSRRLSELRRELEGLLPGTDRYRQVLSQIAVETSRLAGGTDDLATRLERMRTNMENARNSVALSVSQNRQLVGVVADLERLTAGSSATMRAFTGSVSLMTSAVAGLTRVMIHVGPLIAVWLGWRTVAFGMNLATAAATRLTAALGALTAASLRSRAALLLGPKGLLIAGVLTAVAAVAGLRGELVRTAEAAEASFDRVKEAVQSMEREAALGAMVRTQEQLRAAQQRLADLQEQAERQRQAARATGGRGMGAGATQAVDPELRRQIQAAQQDVDHLTRTATLFRTRFQDASAEVVRSFLAAQDAIRGFQGTFPATFASLRTLRDAQTDARDRVKELREEIMILREVLAGLDPGTDAYDEAAEALSRMNKQLEEAERRLSAIEGLSGRVVAGLIPQIRARLEGFEGPGVRPQVGERPVPLPDEELQRWSRGVVSARTALDSMTFALDELALTGQLTDRQLEMARQQLLDAGIATEFVERALRQYTDAAQQQEQALLNAQRVTIAAVGGMAQAWIRGTEQAAEATVNAVTQMLQALSQPGGPLAGAMGGLFGPVVGAVGGIVGAIFARQRRHTQPVRLESASSKMEDLLSDRDRGPEIVTLNLIGAETGELIRTVEFRLRRRESRDATVRLPPGVVLAGGG